MKAMDEFDYVANRVGIFAVSGFFSGAAYAAFKGFPRRQIALRVAASCGCCATTLFASERLANVSLREFIGTDINKNDTRLTLSSYAFGGVCGGSLNGFLYQKQPVRGMIVFVPVMVGIGMLELEFKRRKQKRKEEIIQQFAVE